MKTLAPKLTMLVFTIFMTAMISCGGGGDVKKTVEENLTEAQKVQSVLVNLQTMTLVQGDSGSLSATVLPETAKDKTVKWTSNQPTVATVNNGAIQAVGVGEATITATSNQNDSKVGACVVRVTDPAGTIPVTGVTLNKATLTLHRDQTEMLVATTSPPTETAVHWTSSNTAVATVANGLVSSINPGKATITATSTYGGHQATCSVSVEPDVYVTTNGGFFKNGVRQRNAGDRGLFVVGNDVYTTVGSEVRKNGTFLHGLAENGYAVHMFVLGSDVYAAGWYGSDPNRTGGLWKNGQLQQLNSTSGYTISSILSVFATDNGDVYAAGSEKVIDGGSDYGTYRAVLWKNGGRQQLPDGSFACSVFVSGTGDVYVGGSFGLSKNGVLQPGYVGLFESVYVSGNDVYACGDGDAGTPFTGTYTWGPILVKNGQPQKLDFTPGNGGCASSVFVYGGDVYVGGDVYGTPFEGRLWKNGTGTTLTNTNVWNVFVR